MAKFATTDEGFAAAGIDRATRHLFLCLGPDCARMEEGQAMWDFLKRRCAELKLPVMRTKAGCFRVCVGGPWLLVYPEGTWYGSLTPERCERVLQEHVILGRPVTEWPCGRIPCAAPESGRFLPPQKELSTCRIAR